MKKILSFAVALLILLTAVPFTVSASKIASGAVTGQKSFSRTELKNLSGQNTGVTLSEIIVNSGVWGSSEAKINFIEFDLSNTHLSVEAVNNGQYIVRKAKVSAAASSFNSANSGKTVLAAVNGDLWLVESQYKNTIQSDKSLCVSRGALMIDREVWASAQIDQENLDSTTFEKGNPTEERPAFAVTDTNQPFVGSPVFAFAMKVNGKTINADGLNRLPARNAIIIYNQRVGTSNYALDDAYEVDILVSGSDAFKVNGKVTGTVSAVYPANSTTRPAIQPGHLVLTARGNRLNDLKNNFTVGSSVEITCTVTDRFGSVYTNMWPNVVDAIGGWMQQLNSKIPVTFNTLQENYPTTMIGIKDDGTVAFTTVTSQTDKSRKALRYDLAYRLCNELGYNSVFYLDGGGSTTCVTLENGTYTVRNKCSDGSERAVINSVAVCWNDTPVCSKQGSLNYITNKGADMISASPVHFDYAWALFSTSLGYSNSIGAYTTKEFDGVKSFQVTAKSGDPYFPLHFTTHAPVQAEDYPYIVFKIRTDLNRSSSLRLFPQCGTNESASGDRTTAVTLQGASAGWQYLVVKMQGVNGWTGTVNNIRIDPFDGGESTTNSIFIAGVTLCKSLEEANRVKDGRLPEGAIYDSLLYLSSGGTQGVYHDQTYTVTWRNSDGTLLEKDTEVPAGSMPEYNGQTPAKASDSYYDYTFSGWSPALSAVTKNVTYMATYTKTLKTYTVTWRNSDGTLLEKDTEVPAGSMPEYNGQTPLKKSDDQYDYTFSGWSPELSEVTKNVTYMATYMKTPVGETEHYTVVWKNYDGSVIRTDESVPEGTVPQFGGTDPERPSDAQYDYSFTGWNPEITALSGNAEYTAVFERTVRKYTVTWKNADGTVLEKDENVPYGTTPDYNGTTPQKKSDAQYDYTFSGWSPEVTDVTGNAVYVASFTSSLRKYTVTWKNADGSVLTETDVSYGSTPEYADQTPAMKENAQYIYTFRGWTPEIVPVISDAVYTAVYDTEVKKYTIVWKDENGAVLEKDENVPYGAVPEYNGQKPEKTGDAQTTYVFAGWTPSPAAVTGDAEYTARFTASTNKYTIKWANFDGSILETDSGVPAGTEPVYNGSQPVRASDDEYDFIFEGWTPVVMPAGSDATYTAVFTSVLRSYTVTWKNADGETLKTDSVPYGTLPQYDGQTPEKPDDSEFTYSFAGWTPEITSVTGDAVYTAEYTAEALPVTDIQSDEISEISSDIESVTDVISETETAPMSESVTDIAPVTDPQPTEPVSSADAGTTPAVSDSKQADDTTSEYIISESKTGLYIVIGIISAIVIAAAMILIVRARKNALK